MATSGNKSVTVTSYDTLKFSWNETSQSIANNTTTISWKMELIAGSSGRISSTASKDWSVTVNGTKYSGTNTVNVANNATKTLASGSTTIKHNADGSKQFSYSFSQEFAITFSGSSIGTKSGSGTGTLNTIPRQATITSAPNFNDEESPVLKYSNPAGNAVTSLQACIGWTGADDIAYRDVSKTGTSYTFNLTTAERNKIRNACKDANSMSLKFYLKTVIGGETYYSRLAKTVTIINANPTLSPTAVEDENADTDGGDAAGNIAATGSNTRWIKGVSDVRYSFGAAALKGATIKSYKVECGSKKGTSSSGVLFNVDSGTIKFTVTDSRGNTATKTLTRTLVNYVKLTCNLKATLALETEETAKATLVISGNFFNGQVKSGVANSLKVWYRYKTEGGSFGSWIAVTPTKSGNTYSLTYTVPASLDYKNNYTFEARAQDDLQLAYGNYITSGAVTVNTLPVFDWGKDDFNFNVPVGMNGNNVIFDNGGAGVRGTTTTGVDVQAFAPCNGNNNCVIGFGGYDNDIGATNLYGNDINIYTNKNCYINNSYSLLGAVKALSGIYVLDSTATPGSGWTVSDVSANLAGNSLRMYMSATRATATNAGNITNEDVAVIKVKHNGKIRGMLNVSFCSGLTGGLAVFTTNNITVDDTYLTFTVTIAATAQAVTQTASFFTVPVVIDTTKY